MMHFKAIFIFFLFLKLNFYAQPISDLDSLQLYTTDLNYGNQKIKIKRDTLLKPGIAHINLFPLGQYARPQAPFLSEAYIPKATGYQFQNFKRNFSNFADSALSIYRPKSLQVNIQAIAGSGDFQNLIVNWIQPLTPALTYQIMFERFSGIGLFKNQKTTSTQFYIKTFFHPLNKPYGAWLQLAGTDVKSVENGGVDTVYWNDSIVKPNTLILPVRLSDANSRYRLQQSQMGFWYLPIPNKNIKTGLKADLKRNIIQYQDAAIYTDAFYSNAFRDTLITNDSVHHESIQVMPYFNFVSPNGQNRFYIHYHFDYEHVYFKPDRYLLNQGLTARYAYSTLDTSWISALAVNYIYSGYNQGNYRIDVNGDKYYKGKTLKMHASIQQRKPVDMMLLYNSNHFKWDNSKVFTDEFWMNFDFNFHIKDNFSISGRHAQVKNFTFLDSICQPFQNTNFIILQSLQVNFKHLTGTHLGAFGHIGYQITSSIKYLPLPPLYAGLTLYVQGQAFKHNLHWQFGIQAQYYKSFITQSYMPALQSFYMPNRFASTSTPWVDLYFSARIRPVNFFIRAENILYGLTPSTFTIIEGYPLPGRLFRMGLQWPFND